MILHLRANARVALPLIIIALCLFSQVLDRHCSFFCELEAALVQTQLIALFCFAIWCGYFIFATLSLNDLPLIGLLFIAIAGFFIASAAQSAANATTLIFGVAFGKGVCRVKSARHIAQTENFSEIRQFLIILILLLAFLSWWHLDMSNNYYCKLRWMGIWNDPNVYGMLMGTGGVLAIGIWAAIRDKRRKENPDSSSQFFLRFFADKKNWFLAIAAGMMLVGLVMSYSRGAWLGTAIGLLYLARSYGKLKWRYVAIGAGCVALGVGLLWARTPDSAPWYVKRADLGRPSAQNRATAWRAGLEIMRDHPLGVGWNKAVEIYGEKYSPPAGGPAAITTNDYLMLGTELGIPALLCFVAYVGLSFRWRPHLVAANVKRLHLKSAESEPPHLGYYSLPGATPGGTPALRCACRAAAIVLLVAFWFDGGLFKLPTAAVFWVLLELSQMRNGECQVQKQNGK